MKFKSRLGIAALEELNEQDVPAAAEGDEAGKKEGEESAAPAAAADAAPAPAAEPAATEPTGDASADAAAVDATATGDDAAATPAADEGAAPAADDTTGATDDAVATDDGAAAAAAATGEVEATGEPTEVVGDVAEADPEVEVVEEEMGAVDEIAEDSADVQEDVEKLEAATESLEGCVAILDAAAQRGGLDVYAASLLRNNLTTVTRSLKVKPLMIPALEDMETPSARIAGAGDTKDQIVAFIKRIIDAIKSAFARLGEWIVETYKRLTNAFAAIERRAATLAERVKTSTMVEGAVASKSVIAKMTVAGKIAEDVPAVLTRIGKMAETLNDPKTYRQYIEAIDLCEELVKNPAKEEEIRGKISALFARWSADMEKLNDDSAKFNAAGQELAKVFALGLFNNQVLFTSIPASAEGIRGLNSLVQAAPTGAAGGTLNALSQADAAKVCQLVADIAKKAREQSESSKGGVKELTAEIKKRNDTISALSNAAGDAILKDGGVESEKVRKAILFVNSVFLSAPKLPIHAINRALPRNLSYALDYVAASIGGAAPAEKAAA